MRITIIIYTVFYKHFKSKCVDLKPNFILFNSNFKIIQNYLVSYLFYTHKWGSFNKLNIKWFNSSIGTYNMLKNIET